MALDLMVLALASVFKVAPLQMPLLMLVLGVDCVSGGWFGVASTLRSGLARHKSYAPSLSPT